MSSIYNKGGIWFYAAVTRDYSGKKKRFYRSLQIPYGPDTQKRAERAQKKLDRELGFIAQFSGVKDIPLSEAVEMFLAQKEDKKKSTYYRYKYALDNFIRRVGDISILSVNMLAVNAYAKSLKKDYSGYTIHSYVKSIRILFNFLVAEGYIEKNPVGELPPIPKKKKKFMSDAEAWEIINAITNEKHWNVLVFLYYTGFRINELLSLRWQDIDYDDGIIYVTNNKGNRDDVFPLLPEVKELFLNIKKEGGSVFAYSGSSSLSWLRKKIKRVSGGRYSFQDFRRCFGNRWAKLIKPAELQGLMRHESFSTTNKYYINLDIKEIVKNYYNSPVYAENRNSRTTNTLPNKLT